MSTLYWRALDSDGAEQVDEEHPFPVQIIPAGPQGWLFYNSVAQETKVIKTGPGTFHGVTFNKPLASGVVTLYDGIAAASGRLIGTITFPATLLTDVTNVLYDVNFVTGLTVVTSGATQDITVSYI